MDTTSTLAELFMASVVTAQYLLAIGDRNSLPEHPALYNLGSIDALGSSVLKIPHVDLGGVVQPTPIAEGANLTTTGITDTSSTVTVVRYGKAYETTDQVRMLQKANVVGMMPLANDALQSLNMRMTNLIANVGDDFTVQGGPGSGNDLTVASVIAAASSLAVNNVSAQGGFMGVIHGQQWSDLSVNAGTGLTGGTQQYNPALAAMQGLRGNNFVGTWFGVDWFYSNQVPTANAGADRAGCIFGRGGILWADGRHGGVDLDPNNMFLLGGGRVLFERDRNARGAETAYVMNGYLGVSKGLEAGVTLISDA